MKYSVTVRSVINVLWRTQKTDPDASVKKFTRGLLYFDTYNLILTILGKNSIDKMVNEKTHDFPPRLTTASALPGETRKQKNVSFHVLSLSHIWKRCYYLSAHWLHGDVLLSNSAFFIFAVLVVWCSHSRPYKMF